MRAWLSDLTSSLCRGRGVHLAGRVEGATHDPRRDSRSPQPAAFIGRSTHEHRLLMATPDQPLLFNKVGMHSVLRNQEAKVAEAVDAYDADQLLAQAEHDVIAYLIDKELLRPLILKLDEQFSERGVEEVQIDMHDGWDGPVRIAGARLVLTIPFSGDKGFFEVQPTTYSHNPPRATVLAGSISLIFEGRTLPATKLKDLIAREVNSIETHLNRIRSDVQPFNDNLPAQVERLVKERKAKLLSSRSVEAELGIPVRSRQGPGTYAVPAKPKRVALTPPPATAPFNPEPALADEIYAETIRLITAWGRSLERTPEVFATIGEEDLRAHILVMLNAQFEGEAGGELFNGSGKTDILVRVEDRNVFIGECKIWSGPAAFGQAINQLLGYVVWRDSKAAIVLFIRDRNNPTEIIHKAAAALGGHDRCKRTLDAADPSERSDFVFHADGDPNREIRVALLPVVLPNS